MKTFHSKYPQDSFITLQQLYINTSAAQKTAFTSRIHLQGIIGNIKKLIARKPYTKNVISRVAGAHQRVIFSSWQAENTLKRYSSITGQNRHVRPFCLRLFLNCAEISRAKSDCAELFGGRDGDRAQRCFRRMRTQWLISVDRAPPRAH